MQKQKQVLLMGQQSKATKGRVMLTFLKNHDEEAREPKRAIAFGDAIRALIKRGYDVEETSHDTDHSIFLARMTFAPA